mgnify:CR=1 FL=1
MRKVTAAVTQMSCSRDREENLQKAEGLVRQAAEGLAQLPRVQVYSAGEKGCQSGVLSFRVAGRDPGWVAEELGQSK